MLFDNFERVFTTLHCCSPLVKANGKFEFKQSSLLLTDVQSALKPNQRQ